jgi:hypothetical protein
MLAVLTKSEHGVLRILRKMGFQIREKNDA